MIAFIDPQPTLHLKLLFGKARIKRPYPSMAVNIIIIVPHDINAQPNTKKPTATID
jgi:hypothetical protein